MTVLQICPPFKSLKKTIWFLCLINHFMTASCVLNHIICMLKEPQTTTSHKVGLAEAHTYSTQIHALKNAAIYSKLEVNFKEL